MSGGACFKLSDFVLTVMAGRVDVRCDWQLSDYFYVR